MNAWAPSWMAVPSPTDSRATLSTEALGALARYDWAQVAQETGARYGGVLYVDSLSEQDGPVPTYLKLLEVTVGTIVKGFNA